MGGCAGMKGIRGHERRNVQGAMGLGMERKMTRQGRRERGGLGGLGGLGIGLDSQERGVF